MKYRIEAVNGIPALMAQAESEGAPWVETGQGLRDELLKKHKMLAHKFEQMRQALKTFRDSGSKSFMEDVTSFEFVIDDATSRPITKVPDRFIDEEPEPVVAAEAETKIEEAAPSTSDA